MTKMITPFVQWPIWLRYLVYLPNAALIAFLMLWWPKNDKQWRRFGFMMLYLIFFLCVMHFMFHMFDGPDPFSSH
jgi:hypothetical protein